MSSRERESTIAEHKAAAAQLDAERSDFVAQLEHLKEQVHEKDRHMQEVEEQVKCKGRICSLVSPRS